MRHFQHAGVSNRERHNYNQIKQFSTQGIKIKIGMHGVIKVRFIVSNINMYLNLVHWCGKRGIFLYK